MIKWFVCSIVILFSCGGCLELTTPEDVVETRNQIDLLQESVVGLTNQLDKNNIISEKDAEKVRELSGKIDELQPSIEASVEAVLSAEYSGDKLRDVLIGAQAANKVSGAINPYAPLVDSGLNLLLGILGVGTAGGVYVARKSSKENQKIKDNISKIAAHASPEEGDRIISAVNGK